MNISSLAPPKMNPLNTELVFLGVLCRAIGLQIAFQHGPTSLPITTNLCQTLVKEKYETGELTQQKWRFP